MNRYMPSVITGSVFFGNSGNGIGEQSTQLAGGPARITNCIFRSNGGYGVSRGTWATQFAEIDYCCFSNNTSGAIEAGSVALAGPNNIYSDPLFTTETDGSEDFTLQVSSPCINAGIEVPTA